MEEIVSQDSVVQMEELPVIEDLEEKSHFHRAEKMASKLIQSEALGEFDLFGSAIKLNFNGEENYKTQFGGLVWLVVMVTTIVLTIVYMFPNGMVVSSKITEYSVLQDNGEGMTVFDNSDTFLTVFVYNASCNCRVKGAAFQYLLPGLTAWQTINGQNAGQLDVVADTANGQYILRNSDANGGATIYGEDVSNSGSVHLQFQHCPLFDTSPDYGSCLMLYNGGIAVGIDVTTFQPTTGDLISKTSSIPLTYLSASNVLADVTAFTTNNKFLGYIANVLSFQIDFYSIFPAMYTTEAYTSSGQIPIYDPALTCINPDFGFNDKCSTVDVIYSGTTNIATQLFDDVTAPLLFFLSVSQTLFFITSLAFLRNYANNAFKLRLADSLVFMADPTGRHYNFKEGAAVFLACLLHNHFLIQAIDAILYRCCQTHTRRFLPLRTQMAMDMIDYGQKCLTDTYFYAELNDMYSQENAQPSKIIFDYNEQEEKKEEEEEEEEPDNYFDDKDSEQAFKRMCEEHEYYSVGRKKHLRDLLLEKDKKYKLVLMAQKMFQGYCQRVRNEGHVKEIEIPFQNQELSGVDIHKQSLS